MIASQARRMVVAITAVTLIHAGGARAAEGASVRDYMPGGKHRPLPAAPPPRQERTPPTPPPQTQSPGEKRPGPCADCCCVPSLEQELFTAQSWLRFNEKLKAEMEKQPRLNTHKHLEDREAAELPSVTARAREVYEAAVREFPGSDTECKYKLPTRPADIPACWRKWKWVEDDRRFKLFPGVLDRPQRSCAGEFVVCQVELCCVDDRDVSQLDELDRVSPCSGIAQLTRKHEGIHSAACKGRNGSGQTAVQRATEEVDAYTSDVAGLTALVREARNACVVEDCTTRKKRTAAEAARLLTGLQASPAVLGAER